LKAAVKEIDKLKVMNANQKEWLETIAKSLGVNYVDGAIKAAASVGEKLAAAEARANIAEKKASQVPPFVVDADKPRFEAYVTGEGGMRKVSYVREDLAKIVTPAGREIPADAKRCPGCGTEFPVEEQKMEPHVPKWALKIDDPTCRKCKNASRYLVFLGHAARHPCYKLCIKFTSTEKGFDTEYKMYKPRYTRQQRRAMSDKAKLKQARTKKANYIEALETGLKVANEQNEKLKQKGLEAVAKTVEKDNAILANNDARWSNLVKRLEERVAGSVPLANAIHVDIQHDEYINQLIDGVLHMQEIIKVWLPFDMILHEESDFVVYKKAKEEKPDGS
jgi:hypothetical protein